MKILVTAGSGFIGSHLIDKLLNNGHEVVNLDRIPSKYPSKAKFVQGDILDLDSLVKTCQGIDYIYHLAAEANVDRMIKDPIFSTRINVMGTLNILEAARRNNCKRVLLASTSWIYANTPETKVDEETRLFPPFPDHLYVSGKMAAEMFLINYQKHFAVPYTIMRFDVSFGPRSKPETVNHIFLRRAFNGEPIVIHGSGEHYRQFIYIDDLVDGCVACLKPEAENEIFSFSGAEQISIIEIAENIKKLLPEMNVSIEFQPARKADYPGKMIDPSKAQRILGWKPNNTYYAGLAKYIAWFKDHELCYNK
ncbi:MAG: NAD-dependent epimerase/dehydratase family protein [Candidatus Margulisiibacteriota bacterium]|nr:NAD-dependent epimerase/dehydratase family protein [Candidatus Margulisiibacteriota bacterium]